ncbi:Kinesin-like protein kif9 [Quaeritorhiza haematococci]|nr:Kinesin-like protein kif9 [Quaeritorhiza haematococci]
MFGLARRQHFLMKSSILARIKSVHIHIPKNSDGGYINNQQEHWDFRFDSILYNASQETVYEECAAPIIKSLLEGYNGTILAYGQTGAGKTFTMTGATENYKHRGLIPRTIAQIYREIAERPQMAFTVHISYLEIYNEQMIDLLSSLPDNKTGDETPLNIVEEKSGVTSVKGLQVMIANNEEEALNLLFEGETNRSISEHQLNKTSTRSHCIFTIHIECRSRVESSEKVIYSKLNLVDLAGSERLSKTQTDGVSLKEAMYINKSLTFLEQVIIALADRKREHIPYRQSKLTHVLKDALGGNCNTLMIANIWGEREHIEETISTLRFATRMMCVSNTPQVNVQYDPMALIKKYEREIRELKQELSMHDTLSNRSHVQYEPYAESQKLELQKLIKAYMDGAIEEIQVVNLQQIREILSQFRAICKKCEAEKEELLRLIKNNSFGVGSVGVTVPNADRGDMAADVHPANDLEKHDGVGETEGIGFGIGVAPTTPKASGGLAMSAAAGNGSKGKRRKTTSRSGGPAIPAGSPLAAIVANSIAEEDDGNNVEISATQIDRDVAASPPPKATTNQVDLSDLVATAQLPPLPSAFTPRDAAAATKNKLLASSYNRAEEFETFKKGKGAEINKILGENKVVLKDKKKQARELAEKVNEVKRQIDSIKDIIEKKKYERKLRDGIRGDVNSSETSIIDEEEFVLLNNMKRLKQQYREQFDQLRQTRSDVEYCSRLIDQCRQRLMTEFEQWFEAISGGQVSDTNDQSRGSMEDVLDIGEKFDKLQMERMSNEDPDSLPYYNARRKMERRIPRKESTHKIETRSPADIKYLGPCELRNTNLKLNSQTSTHASLRQTRNSNGKWLVKTNVLRDSQVAPSLQAIEAELVRKQVENSLEKQLQRRASKGDLEARNVLKDFHVAPSLEAIAADLEKARLQDALKEKIHERPSKADLVQQNILKDITVAPALQAAASDLEKALVMDHLNKHLTHQLSSVSQSKVDN